jgi:hypothetical protein
VMSKAFGAFKPSGPLGDIVRCTIPLMFANTTDRMVGVIRLISRLIRIRIRGTMLWEPKYVAHVGMLIMFSGWV